jgi:hypothetical protein
MTRQQQAMLAHQPVDALGVDWSEPSGSPLALEERGDPPIAIGRALIDQAADLAGQLDITRPGLRPSVSSGLIPPLD